MPPKRKAPSALIAGQPSKKKSAARSAPPPVDAQPDPPASARQRRVQSPSGIADLPPMATDGDISDLMAAANDGANDGAESDPDHVELNEEEQAFFEEQDAELDSLIQKYTVSTYNKNAALAKNVDAASHYFKERDLSYIDLRPDHATRPLWIDAEQGRIIIESFSPSFKEAEKFLINIAEPLSRVALIHEYTITTHSLVAAVAVGLSSEEIIKTLDLLSKTALPESIKQFIFNSTNSFGQVRLVLKNSKYMIETSDMAVLQRLLRDPVIGPLRINQDDELTRTDAPKMGSLTIPGTKLAAAEKQVAISTDGPETEGDGAEADSEEAQLVAHLDDDDDDEVEQVHAFEIAPQSVQEVAKRCRQIDLPLAEEYDFRNDNVNADLKIDLNPVTSIRPYQETALRKMFGNGRAKSGIIVLPCGAGKTLVGITAACTIKKGVIVLCTSAMSVDQWRDEFLKWSNVNPKDVAVFTADNKNVFPGNTGIIISTYSMVTQTRQRSHEAQQVMDFLEKREWGLMLLDEVHVVPAEMFQKVTYNLKARTKLGLTATLLREDDKIDDLNFLIGPKLYEANWQELSQQGHIARVQCAEVWCPMAPEFYLEYINNKQVHKRTLLFAMNPFKIQACQYLIDFHERRGDKIIVFSDNVYALQWYARHLNKYFIFGGTKYAERVAILENFQHNPNLNTIFLSKIGDTSLDLPEATCLIQISSHYGSRRQEAQRLGRILRAKRRNDEGFNAFFYSLVSKGTDEMYYSAKRQAFLVDQGYSFKVITHLEGMEDMPDLSFRTDQERRELLEDVLYQTDTLSAVEAIGGDLFSSASDRRKARRTAGLLADFSGGQDMAYLEHGRGKKKDAGRSAVFTKIHRDLKRRKEMQETERLEATQYRKAAGYKG